MLLTKTISEFMIDILRIDRIRPGLRDYPVRGLPMFALLLLVALLVPTVSLAVEPELVAVEHTVLSGGRLQVSIDTHCLLYTSPSPRDRTRSRMPSSA